MSSSDALVTNGDNELTKTISQLQILKKESSGCVLEGKPARTYSICGKVEEIQFDMSLLVVEADKAHPFIHSMDIRFDGAWSCELDPLKELVCASREPTLALVGIRSYLNEIQYRSQIWKWMKEKWDSRVSIPAGRYSNTVLIVTDNSVLSSNRPKCVLSWTIGFSQEGLVIPTILPYFDAVAAKEEKQKDVSELISKITRLFASLLEVCGLKSAVTFLMDCILFCVCC